MRAHRHPAIAALTATLIAVAATAAVSACGSGISLDEPIEGPNWRLVQLGGQPVDASSAADPQRGAQIQFDRASGRVAGSGGCNRVSGTFQRSGYDLRISQLAATKMACADAQRNAEESAFFNALQVTASYRLQGPSSLALLDASGRTLATLSSGAAPAAR